MMKEGIKIISIGDLHGSPAWKRINASEWDFIVFAGDYVDSFFVTDEDILVNLKEIIALKKSSPSKVILLMGNHDLAYFYGGHRRHYCSGYNQRMLPVLFSIFNKERNLFQAAFQTGNYLWTHAGVVGRWYQTYLADQTRPEDEHLACTINRLFRDYYEPLFHAGVFRGGLYQDGGIFWADREETLHDPLHSYHQIIGHTKTYNGILHSPGKHPDTSLTYIDCLETTEAFYELTLHDI